MCFIYFDVVEGTWTILFSHADEIKTCGAVQ